MEHPLALHLPLLTVVGNTIMNFLSSKTLLVLGGILFLLAVFVIIGFFRATPESPGDELEYEVMEFWEWIPPTEEEEEGVRSIATTLPSPIEEYVPENARYSIQYTETEERGPHFIITLQATTWREYSALEQQAKEFLLGLGVDPCKEPLSLSFRTEVKDWGSFDFDSPGPIAPFCP